MFLDPNKQEKLQPGMTVFERLTNLFSQFKSYSPLTEFERYYNYEGSSQWSLKVCSGLWSRQVESSEFFQRGTLSTTVFMKHSFQGYLKNKIGRAHV